MCDFCDMAAELIKKTESGDCWVEWTFPNGIPRLVYREDDNDVNDDS